MYVSLWELVYQQLLTEKTSQLTLNVGKKTHSRYLQQALLRSNKIHELANVWTCVNIMWGRPEIVVQKRAQNDHFSSRRLIKLVAPIFWDDRFLAYFGPFIYGRTHMLIQERL